jgi:hypothetical protein
MDVNPAATIGDLKLTASDCLCTYVHTLKANRRILHDSKRISDIDLPPGSVIFVNPQAITASQPTPRAKPPLPPRRVGWTKEEVRRSLTGLGELGFPHDEWVRALRVAGYNPDRAAEYLRIGKIPEVVVDVDGASDEELSA